MKRLAAIGVTALALTGFAHPAPAIDLKLADVPLSQVIELYSKETGRSVFIDEGVQTQRRVNAHLRGIGLEEAFDIIRNSMGLETKLVGTGTLLVFPSERANRYQGGSPPFFCRLPKGLDSRWVMGFLNGLLPGLKVLAGPGDDRTLVFIGQDDQMREARSLTAKLTANPRERVVICMPEGEARLALSEWKREETALEAGPGGLAIAGTPAVVTQATQELEAWRQGVAWGADVFTPERLESGKTVKAAESLKGRAEIRDLGGTGSLLVEGPRADRERVLGILRTLDAEARKARQEIALGEVKPEAAKEAVKHLGVEIAGDRQLIMMGKTGALEDARAVLTAMGTKKRQVLVRLRLAEVVKSRIKTLGIDLEKAAFGYGEIKEFHPKDSLPLLLRIMNEGKDARILAEPNLRVIEGEEAKVIIGDRIPLEVAATAQTESGSVLKLQTQLQWVDVGIKMTVKNVAVNPDGSIRMGISGEVSSVVATTKQGYPQIRTREATSSLRVRNGGSIVMGGLLSREERDGRNKIPWLGDLPLVGGFARSRDRQKGETEIIMIVTAHLAEE